MSYPVSIQRIRIPVQHGQASMGAYLCEPDTAAPRQFPAVLIGHELFGVNAHIRDVASRIAALGYVVLAADYYYRIEPDMALDYDDASRSKGMAALHQLRRDDTLDDIASAIAFLRTRTTTAPGAANPIPTRMAFVGFSMGGHIACLAATLPDIVLTVCFYAGWLTNTDIPLSQPEPTVTLSREIARNGGRLVYFAGAKDHVIDKAQLDSLTLAWQQAGIRHELIVYPEAGHGFFCDQRPSFHAPSRDAAWLRLQQVLSEELG